jgi:RNA polymerase sigma-70 factor (family 1)
MTRDEIQLLELIKQGDKTSFEEIYERYHRQLFFLALKYLKNKEKAEDAVQDIFVKFWQKRSGLDATGSINGFLFTSMKNHILNMIRNEKKKKIVDYEFNEVDYPSQDQSADKIVYSESRDIIIKGLDMLPHKRREVFYKKVFLGYSNPEIANQLFISVNTVKVHYYHALKFIKAYLKNNGDLQA